MTEQLTERARITFWWPTSGHPVWTREEFKHRHAVGPTGREGHHTETWSFPLVANKVMVLRKYRLMRELGAPPIAARWAASTELQRMFQTATMCDHIDYDGTRVPAGVPMAFFPPEPCAICGSLEHDEWDSDAHPSEGDEYDD